MILSDQSSKYLSGAPVHILVILSPRQEYGRPSYHDERDQRSRDHQDEHDHHDKNKHKKRSLWDIFD
jgi:Zn-finger nucleic acid-binding protein